MNDIIRKTRKQIIMERRNNLIRRLFNDGFLLEEIGAMFKIKMSRVSQIVKVEDKNNK